MPKNYVQEKLCASFPEYPPAKVFASDGKEFDNWWEIGQDMSVLLDDQINNDIKNVEDLINPNGRRGWMHGEIQLLGYPYVTQWQQEELIQDHLLLFEFNRTDTSDGSPLDRVGLLQFWILPEDLSQLNFSRVKQTLDTAF